MHHVEKQEALKVVRYNTEVMPSSPKFDYFMEIQLLHHLVPCLFVGKAAGVPRRVTYKNFRKAFDVEGCP